jgi:hypothetical protein
MAPSQKKLEVVSCGDKYVIHIRVWLGSLHVEEVQEIASHLKDMRTSMDAKTHA